jgi:hypothetical protein
MGARPDRASMGMSRAAEPSSPVTTAPDLRSVPSRQPDGRGWSLLPNLGAFRRLPRLRTVASGDDTGNSPPNRPAVVFPGGGALGIAVIGLVLGLAATALVVVQDWDPGAIAVGPWSTRPQVGSVASDPYARADLARSGALPLATNEGLTFAATTDDTGYRLVGNCDYRVAGPAPAARFWTLTVRGPDGHVTTDPARRLAFTSAEVVRDLDGGFAMELAATARPGNWLPLAGAGPLTLWLRLYDTPLAGNAGEIASAALPSIKRLSCSAPGGGGSK